MSNGQIRAGIQAYFTPLLVGVIGYLMNDKLQAIDARLQRLEGYSEATIELRSRMNDVERRIGKLETMPAKHEETFYLNPKT